MDSIEKLALDTLYGRRIGPRHSCIRTNKAGDELSQCDSEALSVIEYVIRSQMAPAPTLGRFRGADYLVGAYLVIGVRDGTERVFQFLIRQPLPVLRQAVKCSSTFFWKTNNGFNFGTAPNALLIQFLVDVKTKHGGEIGSIVDQVLAQLNSYEESST